MRGTRNTRRVAAAATFLARRRYVRFRAHSCSGRAARRTREQRPTRQRLRSLTFFAATRPFIRSLVFRMCSETDLRGSDDSRTFVKPKVSFLFFFSFFFQHVENVCENLLINPRQAEYVVSSLFDS